MNKNLIVVIVAVVVIVGGYFLYKGFYGAPSTQQPAMQQSVGQATQRITIANFSFQPASATVTVGETVTWTNNDSVSHTVTADDASFDSGPIAPGATFSHIFAVAGFVAYHCSVHPSMHGSITVGK